MSKSKKGRFKKGVSGNPKGRPKGSKRVNPEVDIHSHLGNFLITSSQLICSYAAKPYLFRNELMIMNSAIKARGETLKFWADIIDAQDEDYLKKQEKMLGLKSK